MYIVELTYPCTGMMASARTRRLVYSACITKVMTRFAVGTKAKHRKGPKSEKSDDWKLHILGLVVVLFKRKLYDCRT